MVVAQLVEQPLLMPEVCSLNQAIGKIYIEHFFTVKDENKAKEAGNGPLKKNLQRIFFHVYRNYEHAPCSNKHLLHITSSKVQS